MSIPAVLGVNFGSSFASIAVINKEGNPDCIANEDGERQIACAVSYNGEEVYIGNGAKPQLVKNGKNTIVGFRNLLGHTYEEVDHTAIFAAPLIPTSTLPSYSVSILIPPPTLPTPSRSTATSGTSTPIPPKEPTPAQKTISVPEVTTLFLSTLFASAKDFLGTTPAGVVLSVPNWFTPRQREALLAAAKGAGMDVLQILDETSAILTAYRLGLPKERTEKALLGKAEEPKEGEVEKADKVVCVVDMGETGLSVGVDGVRDGIYVDLGHGRDEKLGGREFDTLLCKHFAKEFTKKTKVVLDLPCTESSSDVDKRAEAKLRLAVEHTKRSLSASTGAATCAVESLKDGMDLSSSINRMRFDALASGVYRSVGDKVKSVIKECGLDISQIDEVILAGASSLLPGLGSHLALLFPPSVPVTSAIDPSQVIAIGCALQALHLVTLPADLKIDDVLNLYPSGQVDSTTAPIGIFVPGQTGEEIAVVVPKGTPLPARRRVEIAVKEGTTKVGFEVWEGKEEVKVEVVEKVKTNGVDDDDEEDEDEDEEEEDEEVRTAITTKTSVLGGLELSGVSTKSVFFEVVISKEGKLELRLWESGKELEADSVVIGA